MTTCADDAVYKSLMAQRSQQDQKNIMKYNCVNYQMSYPKSLVSMLPPTSRAGFSRPFTVDPAVQYQLNPTLESVKAVQGESSNNNAYPPSCGFGNAAFHKGDCSATPYPYYGLANAYNPTSGSKCINYGQDLNLMYASK
jgi:hypothetical protein